ncbi:MAG: histidine kinase [Saprospiraceae bacterium]|nr:histidine kinase [Saprospiraceae bacterium]
MKKLYIYSFILLGGIISLIAWELYKENYSQDYHYFQKDWIYEDAEANDIGILVDSTHKIRYFTIIGHTQDHQLCIRYGTVPAAIDPSNLGRKRFTKEGVEIHISVDWVSDLFNNKNVWSKELSVISQAKILELNNSNKTYYYTRIMRIGDYPTNSIIISSRLITLSGMYLIIFLVIFTYEKLKEKYKRLTIALVLFLVFCAAFTMASLYSFGRWGTLTFNILMIKNLISFYGLWFLLRLTNGKLVHIDFGKKEFLKFLIIALFGFVVEFVGGHLSNYVFFNLSEGTRYNRISMFSDILGWYKSWIYFALANFMSNLTIYIIALRKKEKIFKIQKSEGTLASSTLASIQSRINPHFLYNALNSISSLARTEPKKTEEMALQLAKFYGQCSDIKSKPMITLAEELEILKSYLMIEKIRFGDRLQVILPDDDDIMDKIIPSFTLQPVVENAIKYGYSTDENVIKIRITAETNDKSLILRIYDSGPPFSDNMHSGYGLNSISKKLKVLYPDQHTISFINEPEKCVEIVFEVESYKIS